MSSQPGVKFHDPPVTEFTSMDVDESSQSWMSLDPLDNIYLGLDDELDSDSGSSSGLDVLNVIPNPSSLALVDGLALYDDLDLYLGPEDTLISSDDAPVVPDFPMAGEITLSIPWSPFMAFPQRMNQLWSLIQPLWVYQGHPYLVETPECQSPELELNNEALCAMVQEFMPIGSYDQAENCLGDYQQHHGNLPAPTVAQILEADRPFRMAWAETCDKLRKADADLQRMQRIRESTSEMLKVLDTLIEAFEDSNTLQYYSLVLGSQGSVVGAWYLGLGTWGLVLGVWYSVPSVQASVLGVWYLGLGTQDLAFGIYNLVVYCLLAFATYSGSSS
ncbi:hypothetical protein BDR06DRAFT_974535 [Suillus hirtellus]|nr:hypothetical protein BDR06DRAFT_974535 [Suillus hirtellus]